MYKMNISKLISVLVLNISFIALPALAQGLPAEVITVSTQTLDKRISAVGNLRANESIMLRPEQSGRLDKILFDEGNKVQKGTPLFVLDNSIYLAELKAAQARVQLSRVDYDRAKSLLRKKVGSAQEKDSTLAQLRVDQAQEALAQAKLDKMTIKAPFTGYTGLRLVSPGDYISQGENLAELTDISILKLDFKVPEIYLSELKIGRELEINVDALPGSIIKGEVTAIAPSADSNAHNIEVRASIPNSSGTLRPGLFAKVSLLVDQQTTVVIPEQAIIPQDGGFFVMTVSKENTVVMVPVTMGQRRPGVVQITDGLQENDILITAGQIKLFPGMPVTPIFVDGSQQKESADAKEQ
ncbi:MULTISPECIES: efflux RND transporter periplasmic adaptor subunit [unclassified Neptuniibacter]|uniref:efflux RND transporter periplasmic adaptor subunit n=1 Tax=unclassified Neptuniibacter TaxID=2630693 RepID=UPI000C5CD91B|nr:MULTISPECIES: efflux RND transporter periplasmic adaptor subunit [unclassified Neptuniibacter]MAY41566.1 efflux transporter periplasmic adaptor subunit [Oceanospirillaceae bacterium]|tara:strand:- start:13612 stop:14673 length:1062 start_codon:yes stop_codon:yes gene_type:complete